ncbi:MAG TPA: thiol reductant ABC exporter subunit CydC [Gammaproteobacteria bacterium]|nr:thiol reductant ABC exporter subunit CydC [Gammaproteobacteria bacterium]
MKSTTSITKTSSDYHVFWRLLKLFAPYWKWMALGILLSFITLISNVALLALSGWFITAMAIAGVAGVQMDYFSPAAGIRGLAIARTSSRYGERVVTHEATFRLLAQLRHWFYLHLEPLAPAGLQAYRSGDLLSRIRADIDTLENVYLRILSPMILGMIGSLLVVLFLTQYHSDIALIVLGCLVMAGVLIPLLLNRRSKSVGERMIDTAADLRTATIDSVQGMGELLVYGATKEQTQHMTQLSEQLLSDQDTMAKYAGISQGALGFFANIAMWSTLVIAIPMVAAQTLSPANVTMLTLFTLASFETILPLPLAFQMLPETLKAARRIFAISDTQIPIADPKTPSPTPKQLDIEFEDVSFRYHDNSNDVLQHINLSIPYGKKIAIIGSSGSGKSSLVNLLVRFWQPQTGTITLGDEPLNHYQGDDLRRYFSVVGQQSHLFNSTLRGNLLLANPDASDEALEHACKTAQIHDFIISQPDGYQTWVGEAGLKLSGGQARRLGIARALLKDAPILILDEPGEGLDAPTEKALLDAVMAWADEARKTVILITHKKAGIGLVDEVVRLEFGEQV